ncbi:MAG: L,D-transpeptidase [Clostridiales bacterium]|mgnify:CR=1 FL=1|nr:L,D-transpeptidase [Clostridiales bacterium]
MKLLKLLLVFILILSLTACLSLPLGSWPSYKDENETGQNHEVQNNGEAEDYIDGHDHKGEAIDKNSSLDREVDQEEENLIVNKDDDIDRDYDVGLEEIEEKEELEEEEDKDFEGKEEPSQGLELVQVFNTQLPENSSLDLIYDNYPMEYDYLLMLKSANIRELPTLDGMIIKKIGAMERIALIAEVKGDHLEQWNNDSWYQVEWEENSETKTGFIFSSLAEVRQFQFDKMVEAIEQLEHSASYGELAHISNYKNVNGAPSKIVGQTWDEFGYRRSQSAAGYEEPNTSSKFRYIPDGMLIQVLEEENGFTKVQVVGFEGEYWVMDKYINSKNTLTKPNKVIIVDRKNQNQGIFEQINGQWTLVSYGLSTTGKNGPYSLETPLGYYMAIEKRDKFLYFKDGTNQIAGYAPYAIRFSGGGYIHGVPVDYRIEDGRRIDPGKREYLHTIGTIPRSHMCVRNYTSHAEFLHGWADIGETALIVIE